MRSPIKSTYWQKTISLFVLFTFTLTGFNVPVYAQVVPLQLPVPGAMVSLTPAFNPIILKGVKIDPANPLRFDFIVDPGEGRLDKDQITNESTRLIKYFLASLTTPEKDLWVNLSPYEKDRIVPAEFGITEMGRDLLAQDYILKQLTASLIYPENELGKKFWDRLYKKAKEKYGTTDVPVNTFNKVWVVPAEAEVYKTKDAAFVTKAHLKVMLEADYLSLSKNDGPTRGHVSEGAVSPSRLPSEEGFDAKATQRNDVNAIGSQIVRELIIPELEREVNEGQNFIQLRQIYTSLILAIWFKRNLKNSLLGQKYVGRNKTSGVEYNSSVILSDLPAGWQERKDLKRDSSALPQNDTEEIYQRYLQAYKKGVFNFVKEDIDLNTQERIPRKYFSGGAELWKAQELYRESTDSAMASLVELSNRDFVITVNLMSHQNDRAMVEQILTGNQDPSDSKGLGIVRERLLRFLIQYYLSEIKIGKGSDILKLSPENPTRAVAIKFVKEVIEQEESQGKDEILDFIDNFSPPTIIVDQSDAVLIEAKIYLKTVMPARATQTFSQISQGLDEAGATQLVDQLLQKGKVEIETQGGEKFAFAYVERATDGEKLFRVIISNDQSDIGLIDVSVYRGLAMLQHAFSPANDLSVISNPDGRRLRKNSGHAIKVKESYGRRNIGNTLMGIAMRIVKQSQVNIFKVESARPEVQAFYNQLGFINFFLGESDVDMSSPTFQLPVLQIKDAAMQAQLPVEQIRADLADMPDNLNLDLGFRWAYQQDWIRKNRRLWDWVMSIADKNKFMAHGTGNFQAYSRKAVRHGWILLNIMIEGNLKYGDIGPMFPVFDAIADQYQAADYGPFYVIMDVNSANKNTVKGRLRNRHKIYLVPTEVQVQFLMKGLRLAVERKLMTQTDADDAASKIMTYQEFVDHKDRVGEIVRGNLKPASLVRRDQAMTSAQTFSQISQGLDEVSATQLITELIKRGKVEIETQGGEKFTFVYVERTTRGKKLFRVLVSNEYSDIGHIDVSIFDGAAVLNRAFSYVDFLKKDNLDGFRLSRTYGNGGSAIRVKEEYRGRNIGSTLMGIAMRIVKQSQVNIFRVEAVGPNVELFYKKLGFIDFLNEESEVDMSSPKIQLPVLQIVDEAMTGVNYDGYQGEKLKEMLKRGLTYQEAQVFRNWKIVNPDKPFPKGFWSNSLTAKNMVLVALDTIEGFRVARESGNIDIMKELYQKYVLEYKAIDAKKYPYNGQQTFFYEQGLLRGLLSAPQSYLSKSGSGAALLRLVLPDLFNAFDPLDLEHDYWTDVENQKYHILLALDSIPGFVQARKSNGIKKMAELYRSEVIEKFVAEDFEETERSGQKKFFYEKGNLRGMQIKDPVTGKYVRPRVIDMLKLVVPGLVDIKNPDALHPLEVERDYWDNPENAKRHIFMALDRISSFKEARERNDIKAMADLYRTFVIGYRANKPIGRLTGGQVIYFLEVGQLRSLMGNARKILGYKVNSPAALLRLAIPGLIDDSNPDALKSSEVEKVSVAEDVAMRANPTGGIDFEADKIKIDEKGSFDNSSIGNAQFNLPDLENFNGFTPVIINIVPLTNIPELLGLTSS